MRTIDIATAVIDARTAMIESDFSIDSESLDILGEYCHVIDTIIENHDGTEITTDVLDDNKISIAIELSDFTYETKFKPRSYIDLMERAISISFFAVGEDRIRMEFVFPSVWKSKNGR